MVLPPHCRYEEVNLPVVHLLADEEILELLAGVAAFLLTRCEFAAPKNLELA
ncbi:hypothetical protein TIFTF001_018790 [Ficus carica]|uniref:Uncharacterized protein n=1 Tax=Ficus carica TaxID=3494 RepID=A0AA88DB24_FICCA|nr:hypothetical protein TIFTF001_018790 [Ficus carica]